jgi:hypothetical protein
VVDLVDEVQRRGGDHGRGLEACQREGQEVPSPRDRFDLEAEGRRVQPVEEDACDLPDEVVLDHDGQSAETADRARSLV